MEHFFTSDTHAWHGNIIKYCNRPFVTAEEMTRTIADNINAVVAPGDTLIHGGDFAMGTVAMVTHFREMINCRNIILIAGNHDRRICEDQGLRKLFSKVYGNGGRNFEGVDFKIGNQHVTVCHYAMRVWNGSHYGSWHLYGHSHGTLADLSDSLSCDVGVDCWDYGPASMGKLASRMSAKTFTPLDHHTGEPGVE